MNKYLALLILCLALISGKATSATNEAYFESSTGKIIIPHLIVGDSLYSVMMNLTDASTLTFSLDLTTAKLLADTEIANATDAYFNTSTSSIILPNLALNGKTYYVDFKLTEANTLSFSIELESVTDLTRPEEIGDKEYDISDIAGTYGFLTLRSDGTYVVNQPAGVDLESCPDGGPETGTYRWNPVTGLVSFSVGSDENGECGASHSSAVVIFPR